MKPESREQRWALARAGQSAIQAHLHSIMFQGQEASSFQISLSLVVEIPGEEPMVLHLYCFFC